ncbi:hypothetical protein LOD99_9280 [Oopsacas minuta]|uniref:Uncharacterized protein n=1 Tax=Oopsacas minuta TaxID=111878 RepID=A0AAV7JCA7_9METZ|nr:hypothetical protein LOD99_9280 [Oopsacas minuta]
MDNQTQIIQFQDLPSEIGNNKDIACTFRIPDGYIPHRLDKIVLCPTNYSSNLQELNTWDFVTCLATDNPEFPLEGTVVFPCEKYGYLVLDHSCPHGYHLRYLNREGVPIGTSDTFSIKLESMESATMGMSYVFLSSDFPSELEPEPEVTPKPKPRLHSEQLLSLELRALQSKLELSKECELELKTEEPELTLAPESKLELTLEPEIIPEVITKPTPVVSQNSSCLSEFDSLNLTDPGVSLFPLNLKQNQNDKDSRTLEQLEFLTQTIQELRNNIKDLEHRYEDRRMECEELTPRVDTLERKQQFCEDVHKQGFLLLSRGLAKLTGILSPDSRVEQVPEEMAEELFSRREDLEIVQEQIDKLVRSAEDQKAINCTLKMENDSLKEEYQSLSAVVKDYEGQLILTNQEQAKNSERMTKLSKENNLLKSFETPPPSTQSPRRNSVVHPSYPPKSRPKHVAIPGPHTESIIITEPARGKSTPTFASVDFLKNCSIHPGVVECPICLTVFDNKKDTVDRTKHVNECVKKSEKKVRK